MTFLIYRSLYQQAQKILLPVQVFKAEAFGRHASLDAFHVVRVFHFHADEDGAFLLVVLLNILKLNNVFSLRLSKMVAS